MTQRAPYYHLPGKELLKTLSPAAKDLLDRLFAETSSEPFVDYHAHRVGFEENITGPLYLDPNVFSLRRPLNYLKSHFFLRSIALHPHQHQASNHALLHLAQLGHNFVDGQQRQQRLKICLFAFDHAYTPDGKIDQENTAFYVSNDQVFRDRTQYPDLFWPVISIHPYRHDALDALKRYHEMGARMVKWLPNSMGIDPEDERCEDFYATMKELGMFLLSHTGKELALEAKGQQDLGNPLRLRLPLEMGLKVIAAHCGSMGKGLDLEARGHPWRPNFSLWKRMMRRFDGSQTEGVLYGDLSALTQVYRLPVLKKLLVEREFHSRLINGTDWPWVALDWLVSTRAMQFHGLLTKEERLLLNEIFMFNPLIFDIALKWVVGFPRSVFRLHPDLIPFV